MLDLWNTLSVGLFDVLLGWLLALPPPIALLIVGLATASLLTLIRKWTTNQDRLARAAADLRQLKKLTREAKSANDLDTLARLKATKGRISIIKLSAEGWPLVAVIVPVALLATWAFERLAYYPPRADEKIEVVLHLRSGRDPALSAKNDPLHLVPPPGLRAPSGWVRPVHIQQDEPTRWDRLWAKTTFRKVQKPPEDVLAIWQLEGEARDEPYPLVFRWKDRTIERDLLIGQRRYTPPLEERPDEPVISEVRLREVQLFGLPGLASWLPAWLVGYLVVTIPFVFLLKRVLRIY